MRLQLPDILVCNVSNDMCVILLLIARRCHSGILEHSLRLIWVTETSWSRVRFTLDWVTPEIDWSLIGCSAWASATFVKFLLVFILGINLDLLDALSKHFFHLQILRLYMCVMNASLLRIPFCLLHSSLILANKGVTFIRLYIDKSLNLVNNLIACKHMLLVE